MSASEEPDTSQESKEGRIKESVLDELSKRRIQESEQVSKNAKTIIIALFILVGFLSGMFTLVSIWGIPINEQMVQVYTAAITGSFTLGGVLITQLWGKNRGIS